MKIENWKRLMEESKFFICVVKENFFMESERIEQVIYAKNLNKPIILVVKKGINFLIPDLFENANVVLQLEYDSKQDLRKKIDLICVDDVIEKYKELKGIRNE